MVLKLPNLTDIFQATCTRPIARHATRSEFKSTTRIYPQLNPITCNCTNTRSAIRTATRYLQEPKVTGRNRIFSWDVSLQRGYHYGQRRAFSASHLRPARKWRSIEQLKIRHFLGVSFLFFLETNDRKQFF